MLRALVIALALANLAFWSWTQGWLDGVVGVRASGDREPERLARQVRPESVRILPATATATATANVTATATTEPEALACLEAGPFDAAGLAAAKAVALAAAPAANLNDVKTEQPGAWIVYMGKYADKGTLAAKEEELKRRKVAYEEVSVATPPAPALAPGLSLGRFDDKAAAEKALAEFTRQGVRTAKVVETAVASTSHRLRVEQADAALAARLGALNDVALGKGFTACEVAPRS